MCVWYVVLVAFHCRNFANDIFVFFQRSGCNGNCDDGHEGEKYCILNSQNVELFKAKGY